jgi:pimeloyl-ACP methyl ester carboxylesterase
MNARLIFLPGLAGDDTMWQAQREALAQWEPRVSDVHMRDHGSIEAMAAALLASQAGPLVLCGASMGGMIAMEAARQAPGRVAGLALLGTTARPETAEMRDLREAAIGLFAQGRALEVLEANVAFAFHPDQGRDPVLVRSYLDFVMRAGARQLIAQNRAVIHRPDARLHLPQLRCPTLVMCGDSDQLTPPPHSAEIAQLVPGAELAMVPRCGHMLTMERPAEVSAMLEAWLQRLPAPAA